MKDAAVLAVDGVAAGIVVDATAAAAVVVVGSEEIGRVTCWTDVND
jgi:hypothetical protein